MQTFESTRASWQEPFGQMAERLWAEKHGPRKGTVASLHREIAGMGYEGFRKMIDGQVVPRKDIMEQVAAVLDIDPREFPEYRLLQIHEACRRHPEIDQIFYEQIMETAARLDEKADARHASKKSSFEVQRGREPSRATDQ
jgi:hypothetical protein